ncbi:hypothetical protein VSK92_07620 [Bacillus swezeyi]
MIEKEERLNTEGCADFGYFCHQIVTLFVKPCRIMVPSLFEYIFIFGCN